MIIDTIEKLAFYENLNPLFKDVVEFLRTNDLSSLEDGKHFIKGTDLFVNIQIAKAKTKEEAKMETHQRMIDIQIPLSTSETFGYTPLSKLPKLEYNSEKDIIKYEQEAETYFTLQPGEFVIFFPQDGHTPCISSEKEIRKAIFKVKI